MHRQAISCNAIDYVRYGSPCLKWGRISIFILVWNNDVNNWLFFNQQSFISPAWKNEPFSVSYLHRALGSLCRHRSNHQGWSLLPAELFCRHYVQPPSRGYGNHLDAGPPHWAERTVPLWTHPVCMYVPSPPYTAPCHWYDSTFHVRSTELDAGTVGKKHHRLNLINLTEK